MHRLRAGLSTRPRRTARCSVDSPKPAAIPLLFLTPLWLGTLGVVRVLAPLLLVIATAVGCSGILGIDSPSYREDLADGGGSDGALDGDSARADALDAGTSSAACVAAPTDDPCANTAVCERIRVAPPVAATNPAVSSMVLADAFVYYTTLDGVWRGRAAVPGPATAFAANQGNADHLAADETSLYWTTGKTVWRCARTDSAPCTPNVAYAFVTGTVDKLVAVGGGVLFAIVDSSLYRVEPKTPQNSGVLARVAYPPYGLAADEAFVYASGGDGTLRRVSLDGTRVSTLADFPASPEAARELTADCDGLYALGEKGTVLTLDKQTGARKAGGIFAHATGEGALAVDGTYLYVAAKYDSLGVYRLPKDGGPGRSIAETTGESLTALTIDRESVYYPASDGAIWRFVK